MKKKAALILVPVGIILIIVGFLVFRNRSSQEKESTGATPTPTSASSRFSLPDNKEEKAEVSLTPRMDKKAVILKISKIPSDVVSVEYELSYNTGKGLPRGVLGKIDIKSGQESILREILLGTCSKSVCVYDEGVTKVSLTLKFNKSSGQSTGFAQDYEL